MTETSILSREGLSPAQLQALDEINFLIIGAQKGGTTWLSDAISRHKDAFIPERKEVHFFNFKAHYAEGVDWYLRVFEPGMDALVRGEATPNYMWNAPRPVEAKAGRDLFHFDVAPRVKALVPNARLIVCLRDPIDRAASAFYHMATRGRVSPYKPLRDQLDESGIISMSLYDQQLQHWFDHLPQEQFEILIFENDIRPDEKKLATINGVFNAIGLDAIEEDAELYARSNEKEDPLLAYIRSLPGMEAPGFAWGQRLQLKERIAQGLNRRAPAWLQRLVDLKVTDKDREALGEMFEPHNQRLSEMIGRKLPW